MELASARSFSMGTACSNARQLAAWACVAEARAPGIRTLPQNLSAAQCDANMNTVLSATLPQSEVSAPVSRAGMRSRHFNPSHSIGGVCMLTLHCSPRTATARRAGPGCQRRPWTGATRPP